MEKREPYCTVGGNIDWCSHGGKQYGISSENKYGSAPDPAIPLLELYPKNPETPIQKNFYTPMLIVALFTITKSWKEPTCPSADEWIKKLWYIYTMEYCASGEKRRNSYLFQQHGWNWRPLC